LGGVENNGGMQDSHEEGCKGMEKKKCIWGVILIEDG